MTGGLPGVECGLEYTGTRIVGRKGRSSCDRNCAHHPLQIGLMFEVFDIDNDGYITRAETDVILKAVFGVLGGTERLENGMSPDLHDKASPH